MVGLILVVWLILVDFGLLARFSGLLVLRSPSGGLLLFVVYVVVVDDGG